MTVLVVDGVCMTTNPATQTDFGSHCAVVHHDSKMLRRLGVGEVRWVVADLRPTGPMVCTVSWLPYSCRIIILENSSRSEGIAS